MSIESLKEQARRHEQREEWRKALEEYKQAIALLERDGQPDIGLYNRVGDIYVRLTLLEEAVTNYEKAVDLYLEEGLENNAIAVCKKIIRNLPHRHHVYLRIGQIRAKQGFISDARTSFLVYAERMQKDGDLDESFRALVEFCDVAPGEVDLRLAVADQMLGHQRFPEAVEQLGIAYRALVEAGEVDGAATVEAKVRELDPDVDLTAPVLAAEAPEEGAIEGSAIEMEAAFEEAVFDETTTAGLTPMGMEGFETTALVGFDDIQGEAVDAFEGGGAPVVEDESALPDQESGEFPESDYLHGSLEESPTTEEVEDVFDLPLLELTPEDKPSSIVAGESGAELRDDATAEEEEPAEDGGSDLPFLDFATEDEPSPTTATESPEEAWEEAAAKRDVSAGEGAGVTGEVVEPERSSLDGLRGKIKADPENVDLRQRMVELAYRSGETSVLVEAFMGLGDVLDRAGDDARAKVAYRQVLHLDEHHVAARAALGHGAPEPQAPVSEVAAQEDYVDLGALILGDEAEKSTRFTVSYEEPSGDEEADFAKMLSQFKEKVSQNLDVDDTRAHHDLGTAYKEMGLLDEAVAEFQQALRGSGSHLPTYEVLGRTFLEMNNPAAAVRTLERALEVDFAVEDELLAIYYYLGQGYESVGQKDRAVDFYERVFSLDINFADVTERLRALR